MKDCKHQTFYYYPATNEDGWKCSDCGEKMPGDPPGFRPDLDREPDFLYVKVDGLLRDLVLADLVYVSNSGEGDYIVRAVGTRCIGEGRFDQYSILLFILEEMTPSHAKYWKGISDGVVSGNDPRPRCDEEGCNKLVRVSGRRKTCSEHDVELMTF